jgi:hypothetical protein
MAVIATTAWIVTAETHGKTSQDLKWSDHYARAKHEAAAAQRPLLVVLENPQDPAGRLSVEKIANDDSQVELLEHYQLCRVDVTTEYGKRVAEAFGAKTFPYTAITDKSTRYITFRSAGPMTSEQWTRTLQSRKQGQVVSNTSTVQRVETSKVIMPPASLPITEFYSVPSGCPNCAQYYR